MRRTVRSRFLYIENMLKWGESPDLFNVKFQCLKEYKIREQYTSFIKLILY